MNKFSEHFLEQKRKADDFREAKGKSIFRSRRKYSIFEWKFSNFVSFLAPLARLMRALCASRGSVRKVKSQKVRMINGIGMTGADAGERNGSATTWRTALNASQRKTKSLTATEP